MKTIKLNKRTVLTLTLLFNGIMLFAQAPKFDWVNPVGSSGNETGISVVVDDQGNSYFAGTFTGTVDFDPSINLNEQTSAGGSDIYLVKYNSNGDLIWVKTFGGTLSDNVSQLALDPMNNILMSGYFKGTSDFDPSAGTQNLVSNGSDDVFVMKLNNLGDLTWVKQIGGANIDWSHEVTTDLSGNVFVTGLFNGTVDFNPGAGVNNLTASGGIAHAFVLKLSSSGVYSWALKLGDPIEAYCQGIVTDASGNAYITGSNADDSGNSYVWKLSPAGGTIWLKSFSGTSSWGFGINIDSNGDILTTGYFSGMVDFDPNVGVSNLFAVGSNDVYVHKLDPSGNLIWAKGIGGASFENSKAIYSDLNNDVYVTGAFIGTVDFDPSAGNYSLTSSGNYDAYICKLSSTGDFNFATYLGDANSDYSNDIFVNDNFEIYTIGHFRGTVDFDPESSAYSITSNNSSQDSYHLKLLQCENSSISYSVSSCDNYLSPSGNYSWSASGTYYDTIPNVSGCDSLLTIDLTILNSTTRDTLATACSSFTWYGTTYNSSGSYSHVLTGANSVGCDSTINLNLTIEDITAPVVVIASLSNVTSECTVTSLSAPTATDNCIGTITGTHNATLPITSQGTTTITWTYNDGNGNTSTQTQNVVITDITAPVADVASLSNLTSECSVTNLTAPTASDNCAGTITGTHNATLPITAQGTTTVTWTYNDGNGNTSTQTQNVVITDVTAPVADVATLSNVTSECTVTSLTAPTATDNCAGSITGTHNTTLPITTQGTTIVTWTYDDGNGNTSTQTQNVIITDVTAPVADVATLSNVTSECTVTSLTAPTATDNCAGTITGTHNASLPITSQGTTVVTWTYDDGNGNTSTQTQNVVITDVTAPVADITSLSNVTSECSVTSLTAPTATDNCAGTITGTHNATLPITTQGTTVVTWTYDDGNGNTSTQTQNVVITDVTAPVADITSLSNVTSECSVTSLIAPTATDNCAGSITGTHNTTLPITAQGTTVVTWTYDDGNGNTSTQTQDVVITDVTAPLAEIASLSNVTSECSVTNLTAPTASDNCAGTITGTHNVTLPITAQGTTVVTWTYDDGNGNTSTQTQDVIITSIDNTVTQVDATTLSADASGYTYQWVDCDNGNQAIVGETNQTFVATLNGNYAVEIDNGTCSVISNCTMINQVGIDEILDNELVEVYPNPTNGMITIFSKKSMESIEVFNAFGQLVESHKINELTMYSLELPIESGVYFIRVKTNQLTTHRQIIKN